MATKPSPYTFINDTDGLGNTANVITVQQNANNTNTLVATYNQNNLDNNPQLQILNSAGGASGQLQYNNGRGFGGSSNLTYTESTSRLQLRGNLYVTGNLFANIQTNLNNFHLTGGANGQILTTDGTGNVSWIDPDPNVSGAIYNGNSNVIVHSNGNITFSSNGVANVVTISSTEINLGNVSKIKISGGNANNYLTTDGTGNLFWADDIPVTISNVAPNLPAGHLWFDSDEGRGYIRYSNSWVDFSPAVLPNPDMFANTITFPDGSVQTTAGGGSDYGNSNVAAYLPTYTGNISANYFIGNGASLTGTVANASHASTANTVTTAAQPNISSLGTLSFLSVAGNVNALGNMHAAFFKGNGSQLTGITVSTTATVTSNAQPNITSVGNLSSLSVIGNTRTGNLIVTSNTESISPTSGSIHTSGGIGAQGNIVGNNHLYVGPGASLTAFVNPVMIGKQVGEDYIQAAIINSSDTGSSDWAAYGDNGTDSGGWSDFGFTSSAFNDANYTVTGPNDGYFFVQAQAGGYGGNLVIATGDQGTTNDIIFATGGFQTANIFGRINHSTQTLDIPAGSANIGGNIEIGGKANIDGNLKVSGNVLILEDLQVNGNINFTGNVTQISGNSGQFFGDANGIGALYAGISVGYANVANPVIQASADTNDYVQINFQNLNGGNTASTDYVATADNGDDTTNYIDMGIAGGSWDGTQTNSLGDALSADDGYLYVQGGTGGGNLAIGTTSTNTGIKFLAGGAGAANVRAALTSTGLSVVANVTANNFVGNGSSLSNITGANVTGFVANANIANTAYSVSGANVSGAVSFATTANSVAAANVTGLGNIATLNLTGSSSNVLYGNGVFAPAAGGSSYGDSNVVTLLSAFGSNNVSTTGNITANNITVANLSTTANVTTTGYFISGNQATGGFKLGNVNSRITAGGSNAYITMGPHIWLYPDTAAAPGAGLIVNSGYILANNGSRVITLATDGSLGVTTNINALNGGNFSTTGGVTSGSITRTGSISTANTWGTSGIGFKLNAASYVDTGAAAGTIAASYINVMGAPSLVFSNAVTVTNATTLYVAAPIASVNATITNNWAMMANGAVSVAGNVTVSGSAGISTPNLPAFRVYGTSNTPIASGTTVTTTQGATIDYNQGSSYNNTTGLFTAPVAGLYHCYATIRVGTNNGMNQVAIQKNASLVGANVIAFWETDTNTGTAVHFSMTGYAKCAVGDTIRLQVITGNVQFDSNDSWGVTYIG